MLAGITFEGKIQLLAFCVFEACVGIFWPSMMKLRSQYVPEESRSTIINFFRIPLNLFVCVMLYNVRSHSTVACQLTATVHALQMHGLKCMSAVWYICLAVHAACMRHTPKVSCCHI